MNEEYIGRRYNKLVITSIAEPYTSIQGLRLARVNCLCDCGNTRTVLLTCLKRGLVKSCGCYRTPMKKRVNLIGQTFGKLKVIAEGKPTWSGSKYRRIWICRCECGNIKTIQHSNLVNPKGTRSCGCVRSGGRPGHNNLAGNRYGRLLVIGRADKPRPEISDYKKFWECVCDCGRKTVAEQSNLLSGHTRSCGCLRWQMKRGVRFGKLTLLSPAPMKHDMRYWNVRCDCGRIHTVSKDVLLRAANVYCDCGSGKSKLDLTGQVFSRLTVLMEVDPIVTSQGALEPCWLCRCECGKEVAVRQKNLMYKNTRSCGCLKRKPKSISETKLTGKADV